MKIRSGFVSNSSSSSYLIVGIANSEFARKVAEKLNVLNKDVGYGGVTDDEKSGLTFVGFDWNGNDNSPLMAYDVGISAEEFLNQNMTVAQLKKMVADKLYSLGFTEVTPDMCTLLYGEASSE